MKEKILLYGVCAAISFVSVALTSIVKLISCAIAKRCGRDLSGNVKEYVFTPIAIIIAAMGLYIWLDKFMAHEVNEQFILIIVLFSIATMLFYWLLFQPTRKFATSIFRAIAKSVNMETVVDTVKDIITDVDPDEADRAETDEKECEVAPNETPPSEEAPQEGEKTEATAADKLRAMVEEIMKK